MNKWIAMTGAVLLSLQSFAGVTPTLPAFKKDTISIVKTGAVSDGISLNTAAIQKAINTLAAKGGGVVVIPQGLWMTGPITLKSNINLHLAVGATLLFTDDHSKYDLVEGNWEGLPQMRNRSPISATNEKNIAITGQGIIDGNGQSWRMVKKDKLTEGQWRKLVSSGGILSDDKKTWYPSASNFKGNNGKNPGVISPEKTMDDYLSVKDFLRPNMVVLTKCTNILLEGVTFQNSPAWCLHPLMSENLTLRNVRVKNPWYAQNGDGIDVESCTNVLIDNSTFDVGDDALCMKSGRDEAGRKRGMPTQNVHIKNCTVYSAHGGFVIGSEMSGGARNMLVENCTFIGTDIGLRFKSARGRGGIVENITIRDIHMKDIPGEAILFDMYYMAKDPVPANGDKLESPRIEMKPFDETTPIFRNIHISNVQCDGAEKAIFIRGLPEMQLRNLTFHNMSFKSRAGIEVQEADSIVFENIQLKVSDTSAFMKVRDSKNIINKGVYGNSFSGMSTSQLLSKNAMRLWPDSFVLTGSRSAKWSYDQGVIMKGMDNVWNHNGDEVLFNYMQKSMDFYVGEDGSIKGYKVDEYNLDHLNNGKILLLLYKVTLKEKYLKAAKLLREQLKTQPRTTEGGYFHKNIYPSQMWLDGLYMAQPFMAEYASLLNETTAWDDIVLQFRLMEKHARDSKTGLLYHGWDEKKVQKWANPETGTSPHFWGRSLGWFGMALIDVLEFFPQNHPGRKELLDILNRLAAAVVKVQDPATGVWYDIVDQKERKPNYPEASGSCMLTYTLARGVRMGYLPESYYASALKAYDGIKKQFIIDSAGYVQLKGTVTVSGLGGNPYRDGSFDYYMSERVILNDPKGLGAAILCAAELELAPTRNFAKGKKVYLDTYFNNEIHKDVSGENVNWHYVWNERDNGGYYMWGRMFDKYGVERVQSYSRPTAEVLKNADLFIMVDPDTQKETASPNYMNETDATAIANWVKEGGVLLLMANDSSNAELTKFNILANKFGVTFNQDLFNPVLKDQFEMGSVITPANSPIFGESKKLYIKELSTLQISAPAEVIAKKGNTNVMAISKYGKGTVFILGDPWIYNEYLDGRRIGKNFQNYQAAEELVKWLLTQANRK